MSTAVLTSNPLRLNSVGDTALKAAARFWFVVAVLGQLLFAFTVASFYGIAALRGNSQQAWTRFISHGYVPGDTMGNFAVAMHLAMAVLNHGPFGFRGLSADPAFQLTPSKGRELAP